MEILCSFLRAHFKGVTTDGVMKCYLKEVDNDTMLLFNSIHFRLETLFREHQGLMPMAKNCTLTNSAPIFAMTTTHQDPHPATRSTLILILLLLFSSFQNHPASMDIMQKIR